MEFCQGGAKGFYDFGDSLSFVFHVLPVLLLSFLINILWGIKALIDIFRHKNFHAFVTGVVMFALWTANFLLCAYLANSAIKGGWTD
jgi:hypothetical protein